MCAALLPELQQLPIGSAKLTVAEPLSIFDHFNVPTISAELVLICAVSTRICAALLPELQQLTILASAMLA